MDAAIQGSPESDKKKKDKKEKDSKDGKDKDSKDKKDRPEKSDKDKADKERRDKEKRSKEKRREKPTTEGEEYLTRLTSFFDFLKYFSFIIADTRNWTRGTKTMILTLRPGKRLFTLNQSR